MGARGRRECAHGRRARRTRSTPFDLPGSKSKEEAQHLCRTRRISRERYLRRSETATVSANAISAGCISKCQGWASASLAASGGSGPPSMMPGWPRRPLAQRARSGMSLGSGKGRRGLRTQSRRCHSPATCRRSKSVPGGGAGLHQVKERLVKMSAGHLRPGKGQVSRACFGLESMPAARQGAHRPRAHPPYRNPGVRTGGGNPGSEKGAGRATW